MNEAYSAFAAGYDRMMGDVDYDGWAEYIDGFLRAAGAKSVLECACGTGSLTVRLARKGYAMTGADLSEDMLMAARQKALDAGLRFLPFVCQDMRRIALHKPVDAVVAACDGVGLLPGGIQHPETGRSAPLRRFLRLQAVHHYSEQHLRRHRRRLGLHLGEPIPSPPGPGGYAADGLSEAGHRLRPLRGASPPAGLYPRGTDDGS